eukprot:CAMPEP_0168454258 /NCGR_PEP_ID=MMETSP0228-20121227/50124_1 /TAXON_ID=133427 /ORGANISM="Protoceratium reticulatum, Strain CCCM 535 (=CCMP 1889)" /LENGTH=84 /DNA_ID=CAMNT_0008469031 /DNA_START=90 /DNA_END=341 /DNA_ORIENTATION=-
MRSAGIVALSLALAVPVFAEAGNANWNWPWSHHDNGHHNAAEKADAGLTDTHNASQPVYASLGEKHEGKPEGQVVSVKLDSELQ